MSRIINLILNSCHGISLTLVSFTLPIIVITIGLNGSTELIAEISLIHSLIFLIYFPLSGNARNYLLNSSDVTLNLAITNFRIILFLPLTLFCFLVNEITLKIELTKFALFTLIGSFFWFYEIFITNYEKKRKFIACIFFLFANIFIFTTILLQRNNSSEDIILSLTFYCILYIPFILYFFFTYNKKIDFQTLNLIFKKKIYHHIGGSLIIGLTSFLIKILIVTVYQKEDAGNIFLGFTLGGTLVTFFSYGIGPSILKYFKNKKITSFKTHKTIFVLTLTLALIFMLNETFEIARLKNLNYLFYYSFYFSIIGCLFMLIAQYYKLLITQKDTKLNVIKHELIIGFTTITFVMFSSFSQYSFTITLTYFISAITSYIIYNSVYQNINK